MSRCSLNCEHFWDVTQERVLRDMPKPAAEQGPVSRKSRNFSGDIILFVSSKRRSLERVSMGLTVNR